LSRFTDEVRPIITHEAAVLAGTLNDSLATALFHAKAETQRYRPEKFPHAMPMMLRCAMRLELEQADLPHGWALSGDSRLMGQLLLSNEEHGIDLRFLKERRRSYPGGIPTAGRNPARRAAWSNRDTPLPTLEGDDTFTLDGIERTTILWVWDLVGSLAEKHPAFRQRFVHTTAPGVYGRAVPCDLSLDLLPTGGIFDRLEFTGGELDTDFFSVELDETIEDGD
jgi:hypothetical protein